MLLLLTCCVYTAAGTALARSTTDPARRERADAMLLQHIDTSVKRQCDLLMERLVAHQQPQITNINGLVKGWGNVLCSGCISD